jgi:hypothetical protein
MLEGLADGDIGKDFFWVLGPWHTPFGESFQGSACQVTQPSICESMRSLRVAGRRGRKAKGALGVVTRCVVLR